MERRAATLLKAVGVAAGGATIPLACAFFLFPRSVVTRVFIWPGTILLSIVGGAIPDSVLYAVVPEGGPLAAVLVITVGAISFWTGSSLIGWRILVAMRSGPSGALSTPLTKQPQGDGSQ
jgi:hypothetical protein